METFLLILIISAIAVALAFIGMGIKIILKKNGRFSHTCAFDWDKNRCRNCAGDCSTCQNKAKK
jgi:hypothetical protein